jgi:hypothetical protein
MQLAQDRVQLWALVSAVLKRRVLPLPSSFVGDLIDWIAGPLSPRRGASSGCGQRGGLQIRRVAANRLY